MSCSKSEDYVFLTSTYFNDCLFCKCREENNKELDIELHTRCGCWWTKTEQQRKSEEKQEKKPKKKGDNVGRKEGMCIYVSVKNPTSFLLLMYIFRGLVLHCRGEEAEPPDVDMSERGLSEPPVVVVVVPGIVLDEPTVSALVWTLWRPLLPSFGVEELVSDWLLYPSSTLEVLGAPFRPFPAPLVDVPRELPDTDGDGEVE
jgi:hypothetical protein